MKISKIEVQKKNKDRFSVFVDGEYKFGLAAEFVIKHDLHVGDEITPAKIDEILHQDEKHKIMRKAFRLLHFRERSAKELKDRLLRAGFDQPLVDEAIQDLIADNTIDDERFARAFIKDHTTLKPKGNIFIVNELKKRGISGDLIVNLIKNRDEKEMIKNFVEKKLRHLDIKDNQDRRRIIQRLLNRGFSPELVYDIINRNPHIHRRNNGEVF